MNSAPPGRGAAFIFVGKERDDLNQRFMIAARE